MRKGGEKEGLGGGEGGRGGAGREQDVEEKKGEEK